ncbi:MAG TPA: heme-binding protein [Galbitalea sp.]|jgi:uncharacterized protein (UPF0303 family)|nr:heme-binding protein [Galbitalea sp.]
MTHAVPEYTVEQLEAAGRVDLDRFTNEDAFELGTLAMAVTSEWGVSLGVDIVLGDYLVYRARLGKTGAGNDQWLDGKAAVTNHFGDSSLLVKLRREAGQLSRDEVPSNSPGMKFYGGSIPIYVDGKLTATMTLSGEKDVIDHEVAAEALHRYVEARS